MNVVDNDRYRQANLAQLVITENSPEAEKRREERRQQMDREKQRENDQLNSQKQRLNAESDRPINRPYYHSPNQYWLSPEDKVVLEFYEAQCAEKIKKRNSIVFADHLVHVEGGPLPSPNVILELTKWVKIALSKKKYICNICNSRTLPQRCTKECFFFHKKTGCLAGQLCHSRHAVPPPDADADAPPLFLNK